MIWYGNSMMRVFALKNDVTPYLMYALVTEFTAQDGDEIGRAAASCAGENLVANQV